MKDLQAGEVKKDFVLGFRETVENPALLEPLVPLDPLVPPDLWDPLESLVTVERL